MSCKYQKEFPSYKSRGYSWNPYICNTCSTAFVQSIPFNRHYSIMNGNKTAKSFCQFLIHTNIHIYIIYTIRSWVKGYPLIPGTADFLQSLASRADICNKDWTPSAILMWVYPISWKQENSSKI